MAYTLVELHSNKTKTRSSINFCLKSISIILLFGMYIFCFYLYFCQGGRNIERIKRSMRHKQLEQIQNAEVDFLMEFGICTHAKSLAGHCLPAAEYKSFYIWTKYPDEKTKLWNLANLLTPVAWLWSFISKC